MGQIFNACIYDTKTKTCYVEDADKFHANCYSHSGAVFATHYLLRQKAYRVMWGGDYVFTDNAIEYFSRKEDLLGISTYIDYENFLENEDENLSEQPWYKKTQFINKQHKLWKRMKVFDVLNDATRFFNYPKSRNVKYSGFLINHTQKISRRFSRLFFAFNKHIWSWKEQRFEMWVEQRN